MDVKYDFPGSIEIGLDRRDLEDLQERGYSVERAGFSGIDSKTWVHLPPINLNEASYVGNNTAGMEDGGDLHVYLSRGFLPPVEIEQQKITGNRDVIEHYLGASGVIRVVILRS